MSYYCECKQCKNKEFNPEDYIISDQDFKILDKERPLGISGHLRVKDEAMSVAECIDSCIDALDELIITYNKSTDDTEKILKEYEKKYIDKIKLYYYEPNIIKYDKDEYNIKYSEIHYLANYYNYGYLKIKYKYYMKIDADQIYFTDKLLQIRHALICETVLPKNILKLDLIYKIYLYIPMKKLINIFITYFIKKKSNKDKNYYNELDNILGLKDRILYFKNKFNDKLSIELGGFDLVLQGDSFYLHSYRPINGCNGDHCILYPKYENKYFLMPNGLEHLYHDSFYYFHIGLIWVHLGPVKRKVVIYDKDNKLKILNIKNCTYKYIENKLDDTYEDIYRDIGARFFDNDKKYIDEEFYNKYLKKPFEYAIKYQDKFVERYW